MRQAGQITEAARIEREIEASTHVRPGVNEQERDFIKARLLASRGSAQAAEAIYGRWMRHWSDWLSSEGVTEQDLHPIFMAPLAEYTTFLFAQGRTEAAARALNRLRAIRVSGDL